MRMVEHVAKPTIITSPGEYWTRRGEVVTITRIGSGWARGHYADGTPESWDISGHVLVTYLSENDIVEHKHVWGPLERSRFAGTSHRKCTFPGCGVISACDDEESDLD